MKMRLAIQLKSSSKTVSRQSGITLSKTASCQSVNTKDCHKIKGNAFKLFTSLTFVQFPVTLQYIGQEAFMSCASLESIYIRDLRKQGVPGSVLVR